MSITHPKPKQIRLPFSVPLPSSSSSIPLPRICGICKQRESRYTCPRCNIAYCSLDCFRNQSHNQCSEPFYRTTVMDSIFSDTKAGLEEKKAMMAMLRRFEDDEAEGGDGLTLAGLEESDDEEELRGQLEGVDLDEIESNKLFSLLPQKHRDAFIAALREPDSVEAKELLESAVKSEQANGSPHPSVLPWWQQAEQLENDPEEQIRYAPPPFAVDESLLAGITPPEGTGHRLVYNAIAICFAYLHTLLSSRLPSLDWSHIDAQHHSAEEIKDELSTLLPFLAQLGSKVRYDTLRSAYLSVWEVMGAQSDPDQRLDQGLLIRFLSLLPSLLHPPIIAAVPPGIVLVLSDVYGLFGRTRAGGALPRKLLYYIAALRQLKRDDWLGVEKEVEKEVGKLRNEADRSSEEEEEDRPALKI